MVNFVDRQRFELLGRSNRVCKIEGKRVMLDHVVELLEGCELVLEAAVLPVETRRQGSFAVRGGIIARGRVELPIIRKVCHRFVNQKAPSSIS